MAWINPYREYLTQADQLINAQKVADYFVNLGWSQHAISALIGNMSHESTLNPNMYEHGFDWWQDRGFGLVQWTPRTKYTDWAISEGYNERQWRSGDAQLHRIHYEMQNGIQWINTAEYDLTFAQFSQSTLDLDFLTNCFCWNYERPNRRAGLESMPKRIAFAELVFNSLDFTGDEPSPFPPNTQLAEMPMDYVDISWGEYSSFTHYRGSGQEKAIDFVFPMNAYPLFAPFDVEVMKRDDRYAMVIWKNIHPVLAVTGEIYEELHIIMIHDDDWYNFNVGDVRLQGEHFGNSGNATGTSGISTGDHSHIEVMRGHTYTFPPPASNQLSLYDIFDTSNVTQWGRDGGYDWKVWNGEVPNPNPDRPDNPPPPEPPDEGLIGGLAGRIDSALTDALTNDVYKQANSDYYKNSWIQLQKQMDNTYKIKPNVKIFTNVHQSITNFIDDIIPW